jgi:hypothetical protein
LVERILPDHLAGRPMSQFNVGQHIRVVGLVRAGQGRVDIEGLFAQEDDTLEFLLTNQGLEELHALLEEIAP